MREEKIYLPSLKRVRISNYSLYNGDIDYEFVDGLNLIIGGNGVGKTTFISIIKYALIGLYKKDLDVRVYKGEKRLIRGKYTNCNTYFRSRTEELESDKEGGVELWFNINETEFYVKRSLYDVKIEEANYIKAGVEYKIPGKILKQELYKEDGTDREDSLQYMYEKTVANEANLSDFEDFIFFVNQILLFGESREMFYGQKVFRNVCLVVSLMMLVLKNKEKNIVWKRNIMTVYPDISRKKLRR